MPFPEAIVTPSAISSASSNTPLFIAYVTGQNQKFTDCPCAGMGCEAPAPEGST